MKRKFKIGLAVLVAALLGMVLPLSVFASPDTEALSPDTILQQSNLNGAVTDIGDDPDNPDANWLTYIAYKTDIVCRVSFPTPTGNLTVGADLQEFKIWARKQPSDAKIPQVRIELYEDGTFLATIMALTDVTSDTGQIFSATWNASLLSNADGSGVECYIYGTASPKNTVEVGAIEWNVDYTTEAPDPGPVGPAGALGIFGIVGFIIIFGIDYLVNGGKV